MTFGSTEDSSFPSDLRLGSPDFSLAESKETLALGGGGAGAYCYMVASAASLDEDTISADEPTVENETPEDRASRRGRNTSRAARRAARASGAGGSAANSAGGQTEPSSGGYYRERRGHTWRHQRNLMEENTFSYNGVDVYNTPKQNLVSINEELNNLPPDTPGLERVRAFVQAASVQVHQLESVLPIGQAAPRV